MPVRWQHCIDGQGEIDLRDARIASDHHYMWSRDRLTSKLTAFFASRALGDKIESNTSATRPEAFNNERFHGNFYALKELVLDIPSVVECLSAPFRDSIYQYNGAQPNTLEVEGDTIRAIILQGQTEKRFVLKLARLSLPRVKAMKVCILQAFQVPAMQRRPLHMVLVRHEYPIRFSPIVLGPVPNR